jgi:hypothetical protein
LWRAGLVELLSSWSNETMTERQHKRQQRALLREADPVAAYERNKAILGEDAYGSLDAYLAAWRAHNRRMPDLRVTNPAGSRPLATRTTPPRSCS